jgi:hypothetical protein
MSVTKYIGIRGHRGSGKISIAYLLANAIEYLIDFKEFGEDFDGLYNGWCDELMRDEQNAVYNIDTPHVYLESFGDLPKVLTEMLTSIPHEYIYSDYYKDHVIISVRTMESEILDDDSLLKLQKDTHIWLSDELINYVDKYGFDKGGYEYWMTLREFILYYAKVTSKYVGNDVWVKLLRMNEKRDFEMQNKYNVFGKSDKYKIFVDLKAPTEVSYVKDNDGIIIKIDRPNNIKEKGFDKLENDVRIDWKLYIDGSLYSLKESIMELAKIIKNR